MEEPNWLACSACLAPLVHRNELLSEPAPFLKEAVYEYSLELLEREVPVYSATNTNSDRFDLVRVCLREDTVLPPSESPEETVSDDDMALHWLRYIHGRIGQSEDGDYHQRDGREALLEIERLEDEYATSESSESSHQGTIPVILCNRVLTSRHQPVQDHSWFPPFPWTVAECSKCSQQIGWTFWANPVFSSLIVTRLREKYF